MRNSQPEKSDMSVRWMQIGEPGWQDLWQSIDMDRPLPLQQHYRYVTALAALGADIELMVFIKAGKPVAFAPISKGKIYKVITLYTSFRSPSFLDHSLSMDDQAYIYKAISKLAKKWRWQFCNVQPNLPANDQTKAILKKAGLLQVMTGFSTAWLDLSPPIEDLRAGLNGKWRNQLKKAEGSDFEITNSFNKRKNYDWLLSADASHARIKGYPQTPRALVYSFEQMASIWDAKDSPAVLCVTAHIRREKLAGGLFLLHGNSATYQIGWTSENGRTLNAQNQVLWQAMLLLKQQGIRFLDMGGMETSKMASLTRFKLGTGAVPITYCGSFM